MQIQSVKCSDTRIWYYNTWNRNNFTFLDKMNLVQLYITDILVKVLQFVDKFDKIHNIVKFFEKLTREVYFRTP